MSEILNAIESVAKSFEELKKTNDQMLDEERKGNAARAAELKQALDKISDDLSTSHKQREIAERRQATMQERIEILEAVNSRPGKTAEDKIRSEHKDLFTRWVRSGGNDESALREYKALEQKARELKAVSLTDAAGGFGMPEEISRSIDNLVLKMSAIAANVKNQPVGTSDYKELVSVNEATSGWSTEAATRNATNTPVLRARVPTWGEQYALPTATNWSLEDIFFNVEQWITDSVADAWSVALSTSIYNGNGSGQPTGMFAAAPTAADDYASPERAHGTLEYIPLAAAASSPFTTAGVTADSLINLVYQLRAGYMSNAKFAMNRTTQGHVRKLKDSTGQYLWQPSLQAGQPDKLLGYDVFTWEDLGNPTTGNAYPVVFGDFRRGYTLATRNGTSVLRDPYSTKGSTAFYIARRVGGIVTNNNALKVLKVALS
jgi:HK97 family phage major capsid protein